MRSAQRREVWQLLSSFRIEPVTGPAAGRAGEFMRKYRRSPTGIGIADHLIAGTADIRGLQLAILDVRHFPMFDDLTAPFPRLNFTRKQAGVPDQVSAFGQYEIIHVSMKRRIGVSAGLACGRRSLQPVGWAGCVQ